MKISKFILFAVPRHCIFVELPLRVGHGSQLIIKPVLGSHIHEKRLAMHVLGNKNAREVLSHSYWSWNVYDSLYLFKCPEFLLHGFNRIVIPFPACRFGIKLGYDATLFAHELVSADCVRCRTDLEYPSIAIFVFSLLPTLTPSCPRSPQKRGV